MAEDISLGVRSDSIPHFSELNPSQISKLAGSKNMNLLHDLGEVDGLIELLETDKENGILGNADDIVMRKEFFGPHNSNLGPGKYLLKGLYICAEEASKDILICILIIYILVSLVFGIIDHEIKSLRLGSGTQLAEIVGVVVVSTMISFWPIILFLYGLAEYSYLVDVVRDGVRKEILSAELAVGDMVFLKPGDKVPADGVFVDGHLLQLEELITKKKGSPDRADIGLNNPFIFFGSIVVAGQARMVVTAVKSDKPKQVKWMKGMHDDELKRLAFPLRFLGVLFGKCAFFWFLYSFIFDENQAEMAGAGREKIPDIAELLIVVNGILATCAIIVLTSSLEGFALVVRLTLAYSMRTLLNHQVLIKKPSICRQVAAVDTICFNKTGTLSSDDTKVKEFWIGLSNVEVLRNPPPSDVLELVLRAVALTAIPPHSNPSLESWQSSVEKALSEWPTCMWDMDMKKKTENLISWCSILEIEPFNPVSNMSGVMISKNNAIHVHRKGAADVILPICSHYHDTDGLVHILNEEKRRASLEQIVQGMQEKGLTCVAFAYKNAASAEEFRNSSHHQDLTLLGLVGYENSVRKGFKSFVKDCQRAGIKSRLLTGDSALTAKSLAITSGLLNEAEIHEPGYVVQGKEFRNYTAEERMENVDQIRVLAKATPSDKLLMLQSLKQKGHVVAYVGGGLGDAQAIKAADVGICFGTQGRAEILKSCSDIVILNKSFHLVFDILNWGRVFYNSLETYLQFLLIAVYVDLVVDFVMTLFPSGLTLFYTGSVISRGEIPTPVFQLLWVKLIFGTIAPLSLLTKHPSVELMSEPGRSLNDPLMTRDMQRNIIAQASYQILLLLAIHFMGGSMLKLNPDQKNTVIFTTYMLCQVFTLVYAKMHDSRINLQDIHNNKCFWGIVTFITLLQVMMVEFWKRVSGTTRLDGRQWCLCLFMSAAYIPTARSLPRYIYAIKIPFLTSTAKTKKE